MVDGADVLHVEDEVAVDGQIAEQVGDSCHSIGVALIGILAVPVSGAQLLFDGARGLSVLIQDLDFCDGIAVELDEGILLGRVVDDDEEQEIRHLSVKAFPCLFGNGAGIGADKQISLYVICIMEVVIPEVDVGLDPLVAPLTGVADLFVLGAAPLLEQMHPKTKTCDQAERNNEREDRVPLFLFCIFVFHIFYFVSFWILLMCLPFVVSGTLLHSSEICCVRSDYMVSSFPTRRNELSRSFKI